MLSKSTLTTFTQSQNTEKELTKRMFKVTEVKQLAKDIGKAKRTVFVMVTGKPTHADPYYEITVGYKDTSGYDTQYIFRLKNIDIDKANVEAYLEIIDLERGAYVSLATYRTTRHKQ